MRKRHVGLTASLLLSSFYVMPVACAQAQQPAPSKVVVDVKSVVAKRLVPSSGDVTITRDPKGIAVAIKPGQDGYPGVAIKPEGASWDLARFGHVVTRVANTGTQPLYIALRVDNAGDWKDNPWNTEAITIAPGETGTIKVIFGYAYGFKKNYALKPDAVTNLLLFASKTDTPQSFRIESIVAAGPSGETPPVPPEEVRLLPKDGILLGEPTTINVPTPIKLESTKVVGGQQTFTATFPADPENNEIVIKPNVGRWDLRPFLQVRVKMRNEGKAAITPRARLGTNGGATEWITATKPIDPGTEGEVVIPFIPAAPQIIGKPETLVKIKSDAVATVQLSVTKAFTEQTLLVTSVKAETPPPPQLPDWLGKRPPIPGDWVQTMHEEFDGTKLDTTLWDNTGENYYDKTTHWSKDDVIVEGGFAKLRYEKKTGFHNDDPKRNKTDYAAGYLNGYGKWVQRYGYFEARMKLPSAPGLWPAFWMMPERGKSVGAEQWKRQDTGNGGMEFDIMEHLTRWGPNRYNIAMHYDGYDKDHKSLGTENAYVQPDKDGFITCGLLWLPGQAIYYCNGVEVARWENPRISSVPSTIMFTLPMGGWDNSPLDDKQLPEDFLIDYVRVWQRKDLASPADGKKNEP